MEKLKSARQAYNTLHEALAFAEHELKRDAVIQRFEYTADTAWKAAKETLLQRCSVDVRYPKEAFQKAFIASIITEEICAALLKAVDDRNLTSHTYSLLKADEIYSRIPAHAKAFSQLLDALEEF